jgi:hypothetical protein
MNISKSLKSQMRITQFFKTPSGIMPKPNKSTKSGVVIQLIVYDFSSTQLDFG